MQQVAKIFVSYRIDPDEGLAEATEKLLCAALRPSPNVFVASKGGIRPSPQQFNAQMQTAIRSAGSIIGIITPASRQREWIFFEAGAAWGQGITYAPLLIGTSPSDLPSTISGFQATRFDDEAAMLTFLQSIARSYGAKVRSHWRKSYGVFLKAVRGHIGTESATEELPEDSFANSLNKAV